MDELLFPLGSWCEGLQLDGNCSSSLLSIYTRTYVTVKSNKYNNSLDEQLIELADKLV